MVLQNDIDLLNPPAELEKRSTNSNVLCNLQTLSSWTSSVRDASTFVACRKCDTVLCQSTGDVKQGSLRDA
ncbi:hypothetical protein ARALYDRAFT_917624 [Arabidopsis lyrata subsp. lyrata]|uniref:Uncharacterized protein n=1 Tax=Arabidopsis lyrata subsp. lyrata TaxID=81972 RepID=D7MUV4_ARALL|nr:hypothetical protein ARALYDRAFT_917624 [Arabidopsis lyrata subsp. lyrata]